MKDSTIVLMKFGSHLYGTNTGQSDTDFKGVYLPSFKECVLGNIKNVKRNNTNNNTKNCQIDIDREEYSLQHFLLKMGKSGETIFLDMLHAPNEMILKTSNIWEYLRKNRSKFYTKNLKAYWGYCRRKFLHISDLKEYDVVNLNNWKYIHHALRVGFQMKEIYRTGDLIFPLKEAEYLKDIKLGKCNFIKDKIGQKLEDFIHEIDDLIKESNYPEKIKIEEWEQYIFEIYNGHN